MMQFLSKDKLAQLLLLAISVIAFLPVFSLYWVNWDDPAYITENLLVLNPSFDSMLALFDPANMVMDTYTPLTQLSFLVNNRFDGLYAPSFHIVNLWLHVLNGLLLLIILRRLEFKREYSFWVSLLFLIHPMHVESVAWISARKDLLYVLFGFLSVLSYLKGNDRKWSLITFCLLLLSLLSKPSAVVFPFIYVLIDWYKSRKLELRMPYLPYFLLAFIFVVLALIYKDVDPVQYSLFDRIVLSSQALLLYLFKSIAPINLSNVYALPNNEGGVFSLWVYLSVPILLSGIIYIWKAFKRNVDVLIALLFFLITIGLSLHLFKVNSSIIYDRFTYLPYIGLFLLFVGLASQLKKVPLFIQYGFKGLLTIALMYVTYNQTKVWENDETLWINAIQYNAEEGISYCNLGLYYAKLERNQEAIDYYNQCVYYSPFEVEAYNNRGLLHKKEGNQEAAKNDFSMAISIDSNYIPAIMNRGILYSELGNPELALFDLNRFVAVSDSSLAYIFRAVVLEQLSEFNAAYADYSVVIKREPNNAGLYNSRGLVSYKKGHYSKAMSDYNKAIQLNDQYAVAYYRRSKVHDALLDYRSAFNDMMSARRLGYTIEEDYRWHLREELNQ